MRYRASRTLLHAERTLYVVPERRTPRASYAPAGRTLHLVDLENLMGGPFQPRSILRRVSDLYRTSAPVRNADHVIVAVNPALVVEAALAWSGARLLMAGGPDGADLALLEEVQNVEWVASRYDRVVIGSGDGIFAPVADAIRTCGIAVGVVAQEGRMSMHLARCSHFRRFIPATLVNEVVA